MTSTDNNFKLTLTNVGVQKLASSLGLEPQKIRDAAVSQGFDVEAFDTEEEVELPTEPGVYVPSFATTSTIVGYRMFQLDRYGNWRELENREAIDHFESKTAGSNVEEFKAFMTTNLSWLPLKRLVIQED